MPYTLDQLERFVSSPHYDATTAGLIARGIPALKAATGAPGELIEPGVRRIHGNLCNVHGKYGPCDKALSGKKKPKKGRTPTKPKQTDAQRAEARTAKRNQNASDVAKRMADSDTGLAPGGSAALIAFADGTQPTAEQAAGLASMGLAEQSSDGSYRMTPTGRAAVAAVRAGDYQRTVDTIARAGDTQGRRTARQTAAQERTSAAQAKRQTAAAERVRRARERAAKKPAKAGSGGGKKKPATQVAKRPARKPRRGIASGATSSSGTIASTPKPKPEKPAKAPAKQIAPALQAAADKLSQGATISDADTMALIRNGLARLNKDGELILTAAGMRATTKDYTPIDIYSAATWMPATTKETERERMVTETEVRNFHADKVAEFVSQGMSQDDAEETFARLTNAHMMTGIVETKAQTAEDRAMFAKMGGGGGGGSGGSAGGGGGLWSKGPSGKRQPTRSQAEQHYEHKRSQANQAAEQAKADVTAAQDKFRTALRGVDKIDPDSPAGKRKLDHIDRLRDDFNKAKKRHTQASAEQGKIWDEGLHPYNIQSKSFKVFKDANGQHRWVAQSSTAFQDRDKEIVSTKALADDCQFADTHENAYGPLRWWHTPGLDLGDCDFNAMHGRVLIESGTFRSAAIAQKVAQAASGLEISLGFLHLPHEPDADGVFHHIRRFERSLVPRGKASNRFTAFTVKETTMFDPTKVAALKALGFSDDEITGLQTQAAATEKAATDQGVAYKSDDVAPPDEITIGGVVYAVKAFLPKADAESVEEVTDAVIEEDAIDDMPMEEEADDPNALTLSPGDLSAIQEMIGAAIGQIMGGLDLEKKVAGHVQGMLAPYQATKDDEQAQTKEQIAALATQIAELTGSQPAARAYRPSVATDNVLTDATMLAAVKQIADPDAHDPWSDIRKGLGIG